jgi:hypothetical protein
MCSRIKLSISSKRRLTLSVDILPLLPMKIRNALFDSKPSRMVPLKVTIYEIFVVYIVPYMCSYKEVTLSPWWKEMIIYAQYWETENIYPTATSIWRKSISQKSQKLVYSFHRRFARECNKEREVGEPFKLRIDVHLQPNAKKGRAQGRVASASQLPLVPQEWCENPRLHGKSPDGAWMCSFDVAILVPVPCMLTSSNSPICIK